MSTVDHWHPYSIGDSKAQRLHNITDSQGSASPDRVLAHSYQGPVARVNPRQEPGYNPPHKGPQDTQGSNSTTGDISVSFRTGFCLSYSPSFGGSCNKGSWTSFRLTPFPGPLLLDP